MNKKKKDYFFRCKKGCLVEKNIKISEKKYKFKKNLEKIVKSKKKIKKDEKL